MEKKTGLLWFCFATFCKEVWKNRAAEGYGLQFPTLKQVGVMQSKQSTPLPKTEEFVLLFRQLGNGEWTPRIQEYFSSCCNRERREACGPYVLSYRMGGAYWIQSLFARDQSIYDWKQLLNKEPHPLENEGFPSLWSCLVAIFPFNFRGTLKRK